MSSKSKTRNHEETLYYGASSDIVEKAKTLRKRMTEAEVVLWTDLRDKKLDGLKFRRQHPIWIFIADFYCHRAKLVIELDGGIHQVAEIKEYDINRTVEIERFEIKVIRFSNEEVIENIDEVLDRIKKECKKRNIDPIPGPSPQWEGSSNTQATSVVNS